MRPQLKVWRSWRSTRRLVLETLEDRLCLSTWSEPVNLGPVVNSQWNDYHPAISNNGLSLYITSDRPGGFGREEDIWVSQRASLNDPWGLPQHLGPNINSLGDDDHVGGACCPNLSPDEHWLYFSSERPGGFGGANLWVSHREDTADDFGWESPLNLGPRIHSGSRGLGECAPTYFHDEQTGLTSLYFCRDQGDLGDFDIYVSTLRPDDVFGVPALVWELSSPYRDTRTAIRRDGLEMFITSNRPGTIGTLDIWVSTRETTVDAWSTPVDLGTPINIAGFATGGPALSSDGNTMFFFSTRPGGFGGRDLYMSTRLDDGPQPPAGGHRLHGVDPIIVQVLGSFSGSDDRGISGNVHDITAGQDNSVPPQQTRESQAGALYAATSSLVANSSQRQATDNFFAARSSANPAREPLGWGTAAELDLLVFNRLGDL